MKLIVQDTAIIWALTFLSGFIVGVTAKIGGIEPAKAQIGIAVGNIIFSAVGFTIVGSLTKTDRFRYMTKVALLLWITGLINLLFGYALTQWLLSILFIFFAMLIGGAISLLIVPAPRKSHE